MVRLRSPSILSVVEGLKEISLQAVDFVSWAIFRKLEFGDDAYYNFIKKKIVEEDSLYP